jgi:DNA ligase-associated metallophosphoesterase
MDSYAFTLNGASLLALGTGALWWPEAATLVVADLHFGKSERIARRGGPLLPPYDTVETLARLAADLDRIAPARLVCLGDSFDDDAAARALTGADRDWLAALAARQETLWVAGNHDPAPPDLPGRAVAEWACGPITFRHQADPQATGEISGHFHPKARVALPGLRLSRACFLIDARRAILPAYGRYTGGLDSALPPLCDLMGPDARAVLVAGQRGGPPRPVPLLRASSPHRASTAAR